MASSCFSREVMVSSIWKVWFCSSWHFDVVAGSEYACKRYKLKKTTHKTTRTVVVTPYQTRSFLRIRGCRLSHILSSFISLVMGKWVSDELWEEHNATQLSFVPPSVCCIVAVSLVQPSSVAGNSQFFQREKMLTGLKKWNWRPPVPEDKHEQKGISA